MESSNKEEQIIKGGIDRRSFISKATLAAIGTAGASSLISSCSREPAKKNWNFRSF